MNIFAAILIFGLATQIESKFYSKCEFARTMRNAGFSVESLPQWVCLVQHESNFNSNAINKINPDGSWDWGIFQINDHYWCRRGYAGNECNMDCNRLINDDINDDITCTKKIYGVHGYSAWVAWVNYCKGKSLANYQVKECF